jgi:hypothetical protein
MAGGFITPRRGVEAHRAIAREIDEEVQIETPRISAEPRALQDDVAGQGKSFEILTFSKNDLVANSI